MLCPVHGGEHGHLAGGGHVPHQARQQEDVAHVE